MICPECKAENKKSRVYAGPSSSTCMHCAPYYDEDGKHHYHDINTSSTSYSCSNGHEWSESSQGSCWCGWPDKEAPSGGVEVPVNDEGNIEITSKEKTDA